MILTNTYKSTFTVSAESAHIWLSAISEPLFDMLRGLYKTFHVYLSMLWARGKKKIFNSVILFIMVNVMHYFFRVKKTTKLFLHDQSMFNYIAVSSCSRMSRFVDVYVPTNINLAASPLRVVLSSIGTSVHVNNYRLRKV